MKIKKIEQSVGVLSKVNNSYSDSDKNTYSCAYIDTKLNDIDTNLNGKVGTYVGDTQITDIRLAYSGGWKIYVTGVSGGKIMHFLANLEKID